MGKAPSYNQINSSSCNSHSKNVSTMKILKIGTPKSVTITVLLMERFC